MASFYLYILKCCDNSYYVGHTDDIDRRILEHKKGLLPGYTKTRQPITVVYIEAFDSRDDVKKIELKLKKWSRKKKEAYMKKDWTCLSQLCRRGKNSKKI